MKTTINNKFYDQLHNQWYNATNHPIAILRAEQKIKNPWVKGNIDLHFHGTNDLSILDIGCGAGFLTNELSKYYKQVIGIDQSDSTLQVARDKDFTGKVKYIPGDAYHLPFPDKSLDVVCAMDFLEHVDRPEKIIQEAGRILKPNGLFFFHTFNRNFISWLVVIKFMEWFMPNTPNNMHIISLFIKPKELSEMMNSQKLKPQLWEGIRPQIDYPFIQSFLTRRVHKDFTFTTTNSLTMGYLGYAIKTE